MTKSLFLTVLFLLACSGNNKNVVPVQDPVVIEPSEKNMTSIQPDFFEVANIDTQGTWLQRIFVVIPPASVDDTAKIRQIICALKLSYPLTNQSNISFFSDKKYANYKSELFDGSNPALSQADYEKWMNNDYLGEYAFETNEYRTFPASYKNGKQKSFTIETCR